jgi:putative endonuclease
VKQYYVYILTNKSRTLYTGVTNDLERRVYEHKQKLVPGFTAKYKITFSAAIEREKQIKGWLRVKKVALIESVNPDWADLSVDRSLGSTDALNDSEILRSAQNDKKGQRQKD